MAQIKSHILFVKLNYGKPNNWLEVSLYTKQQPYRRLLPLYSERPNQALNHGVQQTLEAVEASVFLGKLFGISKAINPKPHLNPTTRRRAGHSASHAGIS